MTSTRLVRRSFLTLRVNQPFEDEDDDEDENEALSA